MDEEFFFALFSDAFLQKEKKCQKSGFNDNEKIQLSEEQNYLVLKTNCVWYVRKMYHKVLLCCVYNVIYKRRNKQGVKTCCNLSL